MATAKRAEISLLTSSEEAQSLKEGPNISLIDRRSEVVQELNDATSFATKGARSWLSKPNFPHLAEVPELLAAFQSWAEEVGPAASTTLPSLDRAIGLGMPELVTIDNYQRELGHAPAHRVTEYQLEAAVNAFRRTSHLLECLPEAIDEISKVDPKFAEQFGYKAGRGSVDARFARLSIGIAVLHDANNVIALSHKLGGDQGLTIEEVEGEQRFKIEVTDVLRTHRTE